MIFNSFSTPSYIKFMKDVFYKKCKLGDFEIVVLIEECSAILQHKLPPKLKDLGSFTIPYSMGSQLEGRVLCDLGASINIIHLYVSKELGLGEVKLIYVILQLADRSLTYPHEIIEDILIQVDKLIFLANFVVLDFAEDYDNLITLGRPFVAIGRALIDVQKRKLTTRIVGHNF